MTTGSKEAGVLGRVLTALRGEDPEERRGAVIVAAELSGGDAVRVLITALGDPDWRVRKEAARVGIEHVEARAMLLPALIGAFGTAGAVGLHNSAVEVLVGSGSEAVPVLLAALPHLNASAGKFVLEALGDIGDRAATPALLDSCRNPDPNLRAAAIEALGRVGGPEAREALTAIVAEQVDPFLKLVALESSQRSGAVLPVPLLLGLAEDQILRRAALLALGRTRAVEAIAPLTRALHDRSRGSATAAVLALGGLVEMAPDRADALRAELGQLAPAELGLLGDLVRAGNVSERQAAVRLLGLCAGDAAVVLLAGAAADDDLAALVDASLRSRGPGAASALLEAAIAVPPRALPVLLPVLTDAARGASIEATVAARLQELLSSEEEGVAASAADCLGTLDGPSAAPALARLLRGSSGRVARAAAQSLAAIGERHAHAVRSALVPFAIEGPAGALVAALLGTVGGPEDVALLRAALGADETALRRAAVEALARLGGEAAVEAVILALADESDDVQAAAAAALGRAGGRRAVESLLAALSGPAPRVVASAARALGELAEITAAEPLRQLVGSLHGMVAVAAIAALGRLGDGGSGGLDDRALDGALAHADTEVVKHALRLAAKGEGTRAHERLVRALHHEAWDVRQSAVRLLAARGGAPGREALARRLPLETDELVRAALVKALAAE